VTWNLAVYVPVLVLLLTILLYVNNRTNRGGVGLIFYFTGLYFFYISMPLFFLTFFDLPVFTLAYIREYDGSILVYSLISLLFIYLGSLSLNFIRPIKAKKVNPFIASVDVVSIWMFNVVLLALILFWLVIMVTSKFQVLQAILLAEEGSRSLILDYRLNRTGLEGVLRIAIPHLLIFAVICNLYQYFVLRKKGLFIYLFLIFGLFILYLMQFRGVMLIYLITLAISSAYFNRKYASLKFFLILGVVSIFFLIILTTVQLLTSYDEINNGWHKVRRLFTPISQLGFTYDNFSEYGTAYGGSLISDLLVLGGGADLGLNGQVARLIGEGAEGATATITLLGEVYFNYGLYLSMFYFFILGVCISLIEYFSKSKMGFMSSFILIFFSIYLIRSIIAGFGELWVYFILGVLVFLLFSFLRIIFTSKPRGYNGN